MTSVVSKPLFLYNIGIRKSIIPSHANLLSQTEKPLSSDGRQLNAWSPDWIWSLFTKSETSENAVDLSCRIGYKETVQAAKMIWSIQKQMILFWSILISDINFIILISRCFIFHSKNNLLNCIVICLYRLILISVCFFYCFSMLCICFYFVFCLLLWLAVCINYGYVSNQA